MKDNLNISDPIIMDNKNLRKDNPVIQEHFDACFKELDSFPKEDGIIVDPSIVDWISCPVCGSHLTSQWMVKWGGRYDECQKCSHIFVKNRFKNHVLLDFYQESEADKKDREVQKYSFNDKYWKAVYGKYMDFLWDIYSKEASILDVGCGSGHFLKFCFEEGAKNIYGLDVHADLHNQGLDFLPRENLFRVDSFETSVLNHKFDMIFLWGVLEHLPDPNMVLSKCKAYLNENGKIFILVPNIHSRARKILGVSTPTINPRQHINFFTPKSMQFLCAQHNLKIAYLEHELPIIDLMWPYVHEEEALLEDINIKKEGYCHIYVIENN